MQKILKHFLFIFSLTACSSIETQTEDIASMLHGRWEYTGKYKGKVFYPDTISSAGGVRAGENYILYNILSDSGNYQHVYAGNLVRIVKIQRPYVVEYNTQVKNFTEYSHFYDPESDNTNEKKMFKSNFRIEIQDKPFIANGISKIPILELTNDKLIIEVNGFNKHYKKHENSH